MELVPVLAPHGLAILVAEAARLSAAALGAAAPASSPAHGGAGRGVPTLAASGRRTAPGRMEVEDEGRGAGGGDVNRGLPSPLMPRGWQLSWLMQRCQTICQIATAEFMIAVPITELGLFFFCKTCIKLQ